MPAVYIHGLRSDEVTIRAFRNELPTIIAGEKEFGLAARDINVYILPEYAPPDCPNITVEVRGLTAETSLDAQNALAKTVLDAIRAFLHRPEYLQHASPVDRVEVFVVTFDPEEQGYASSAMRYTRLSLV